MKLKPLLSFPHYSDMKLNLSHVFFFLVCISLSQVSQILCLSLEDLDIVKINCSSHYEFGHELGKIKGSEIKAYFDSSTDLHGKYIPWAKKEALAYKKFYEMNKAAYPAYFEEMQGLSDSVGIEFEQIFLMMIAPELDMILWNSDSDHTLADACSDVMFNGALAHNEDEDPNAFNSSFWVEARIQDKTLYGFAYPAYGAGLPGGSFGTNSDGISLTVNALFPKDVVPGLCVNLMARDILGATDAEDARTRASKPGRASGGSFNIHSKRENVLVNIETGPGSGQIGVRRIKEGDSYWHFNMYDHLNVSEHSDTSSVHRRARSQELPPPKNLVAVKQLIGDTYDPQYPIYRDAHPPDAAMTLATAIFDFESQQLLVYRSNPKVPGTEPVLVIDL